MTGINTLTQSLWLSNRVFDIQQDIATATQQLSTTLKASDFSGLSGGEGRAAIDLRAQRARLDSYNSTIAALSTRNALISQSLNSIHDTIKDVSSTAISSNFGQGTDNGVGLQITSQSALGEVINRLNAQTSGNSVFAGNAVSQLGGSFPIADFNTISGAVQAAITAGGPFATPAAAQTAVDNWFAANTATWFLPAAQNLAGGTLPNAVNIDDNVQVQAAASASPTVQPAYREVLSAVAALAYVKQSDFANPGDYTAFAQNALNKLDAADKSLLGDVARYGVVGKQLQDQQQANTASITLIETHIANNEGVNIAEVNARLSALQVQLASTLKLTADLKDLSLVNFLR